MADDTTTQPSTRLSTEELTLIETRLANEKKSLVAAYLLLIFLGGFGVHNFYIGRTALGSVELALFLIGLATAFFGIGLVLFIPLAILLFVDLFILPGGAQKHTERRREQLVTTLRTDS